MTTTDPDGRPAARPRRLRPPFPYFGSKQTLAPWIVERLPAHLHYVEPYGGSLAVLLAKAPSVMETVNDLDGDVMIFWEMLRERPAELARVCALTPHSRVEYARSQDRDGCDDLERARRVWIQLTQGRGGTLRRSGWRGYVKPVGGTPFPRYLDGYVERMALAAERLHHVSLECRPALDIIARYGAEPDILLYIDPPYIGESRSFAGDPRRRTGRYRLEMLADTQHETLLDAVADLPAAVVLSGYGSQMYTERLERLAGWHHVTRTTGTGQSARGEWSERTEVLWSNRPFPRPASS